VRVDIKRYLLQRSVANALAVLVVMSVHTALVFVAVVYVAPTLGLLQFDLVGYGSGYPAPQAFARLTELWAISPVLYGAVYSLWSGLNGAVWASVGFAAVLLIRNRFLALAAPFVICLIITVGFQLLMADLFAPLIVWMLFGYVQTPPLTAVIPLAILLLGSATAVAVVIRKSPGLETLR
jgi:hypothetical protein